MSKDIIKFLAAKPTKITSISCFVKCTDMNKSFGEVHNSSAWKVNNFFLPRDTAWN